MWTYTELSTRTFLFLLISGLASEGASSGPHEIYRAKNLWLDSGHLFEQIESETRIVDLRSKRVLFRAKDRLQSPARSFIRVFGTRIVVTTRQDDAFHISIFSLADGKFLWRMASGSVYNPEPMALVGDSLFVANSTGIFKLSRRGEILARKEVPDPHSFTMRGEYVYFCSEHHLFRLDAATLTKGWKSYCDPMSLLMGLHGPVIHGNLHWSIRGIGMDGKILWTTREPSQGFRDYVSTDLKFAETDRIAAIGSRWRLDSQAGTMLSKYLYLYSTQGALLWKKPMAARGAVVFGDHVAVIASGKRSGTKSTIQIRHCSDGRIVWESRPGDYRSIESQGQHLLVRGSEADILYKM